MSSTDTQCLALPMGATCYWKDMWQQLNSMRSQFQLCDVILSTIDDGMYGAHSPVLAASSNVFYEYFLSKSNCSSVITQLDSSKNIKLLINGINRQVLHVSIYKNMVTYFLYDYNIRMLDYGKLSVQEIMFTRIYITLHLHYNLFTLHYTIMSLYFIE